MQTLDVERVLRAAVTAKKSMAVDAAVKAITGWVNINSKERRVRFGSRFWLERERKGLY